MSAVLIETYWNVNVKDKSKTIGFAKVLIETYWNVNVVYYPLDEKLNQS